MHKEQVIPRDVGKLAMRTITRTDRARRSADAVPREYTNEDFEELQGDFSERESFKALKCSCGNRTFEVIKTDDYETTAHCSCGVYYVVHEG